MILGSCRNQACIRHSGYAAGQSSCWQLNLNKTGERTYQRHGVDGADDDGRQPESDDGAAGVGEDRALVLDGVPLLRAHHHVRSRQLIHVVHSPFNSELHTAGVRTLAFKSAMSSSPLAAEESSEEAFTRSSDSLGGAASWSRRGSGDDRLRRGRRRAAEGGAAAPAAGRRAPPRSAVEYAVAAMPSALSLALARRWPLLRFCLLP